MKQRLGIAAAIVESPDLILLDEPFNALDESGIKEIRDLLRELRQKGKLIVLTCHDRQQMESLADEIIAMREGRIANVDKNKPRGGFEVKTNDFIIVRFCFLLLLLVLSFAIGLRITRLNGSYLATEDCYGYPQKPIDWNGLKINCSVLKLLTGKAFLQEYNIDRESIFSDSLSEKTHCFIYL